MKNPLAWPYEHTQVVKVIKSKVKPLSYLGIFHPNAVMIVETNVSDISFDGVLKQCLG